MASAGWCAANAKDVGDTNQNYGAHPVGGKPDGGHLLDLADMTGNVWEWCWDWEGDLTMGNVSNPEGPAGGTVRILEGGSWSLADQAVVHHSSVLPDTKSSEIGFRIVVGN
jgi:formylglycine-generating enzyme required for sulfatase activity